MELEPGYKQTAIMSEGVDAQCREETKQKVTDSSKDTKVEGELKHLTEGQVKLIASTWATVSEDLQGAGLIMFKK